MKKIALTGGGTAGHVMPHLALIPEFKQRQWQYFYVGSSGIEKEIITQAGIEFHQIQAGKLRRYLSFQNLLDIFKVTFGTIQAFVILFRKKPDVIFSKGGFVSVPVCMAGWMLGIPVITHESDLTPGLATRIISRVARKVLCTFEETVKYLPQKGEFVGAVIRQEIFQGNKEAGLRLAGFAMNDERPVVLFAGGSLGAQRINDCLVQSLDELTKSFRIIHLTGTGKSHEVEKDGYKSFEYLGPELKDVLAATDLVVARAGANSIFEFLSLNKPMLLIPLEIGSRGDQVHNAESFASKGWASILRESDLKPETLQAALNSLQSSAESQRQSQTGYSADDAKSRVLSVLA